MQTKSSYQRQKERAYYYERYYDISGSIKDVQYEISRAKHTSGRWDIVDNILYERKLVGLLFCYKKQLYNFWKTDRNKEVKGGLE